MPRIFLCISLLFSWAGLQAVQAQDTFSIVALDSSTREVGSAGGSCLDLSITPFQEADFLTKLIPDTGAVNIQSLFIQANQDNAVARLRLGNTAQQVIDFLVANDPLQNPEFKQHGVVSFNGGQPSAAAHTGTACIEYKNHVVGSINGFHYAIQGNVLKGQLVLDSMEKGFRNTNGGLACRLMAAMQGANIPGADIRCLNEGLSSKFAFLQVAKPTDVFEAPSLRLRVKTFGGQTIEPIDSLQQLFDASGYCQTSSIQEPESASPFSLSPNPLQHDLEIKSSMPEGRYTWLLYSATGTEVDRKESKQASFVWDMSSLPAGILQVRCMDAAGRLIFQKRLIKKSL
jgi:uncharacterized Ntn-hydrolase superfamily protein